MSLHLGWCFPCSTLVVMGEHVCGRTETPWFDRVKAHLDAIDAAAAAAGLGAGAGAGAGAVVTPRCPLCDQEPVAVFNSGRQAVCPNADCRIWAWDPTMTAAAQWPARTELDLGDVSL
jgi:hypothetical protein